MANIDHAEKSVFLFMILAPENKILTDEKSIYKLQSDIKSNKIYKFTMQTNKLQN
jgi:hypothetical protein